MTAREILDIIDNHCYTYYGIRVDDNVIYSIGDHTAASRVWVDGDATDELLDGTSCIGFSFNADERDIDKVFRLAANYFGDNMYLIGGDSMEYGEDDGEYVIQDAIVIGIFSR